MIRNSNPLNLKNVWTTFLMSNFLTIEKIIMIVKYVLIWESHQVF